jgi:branched-chain amino acid transport system substrate-binding protein
MASAETGRRNFLKYAVTAVVCGVVAGVGGWFAGTAAMPPPKTVTETMISTTTVTAPAPAAVTVTKTVTPPPTTVTKTITVKPTPPAPTGPPIKIGYQIDLTGVLASYGYWQKISFEQAIKKLNEEGGIAGRPVEGIMEDSASKSDVGIAAFKKLVLDFGCDFVLGTTHSGIAMATAPLAKELKIPYLVQGAMSHAVTVTGKGNRWLFRYISQVRQQTAAFAKFAVENIAKKWTTYYWDYAWGQSHDIYFSKLVEKYGGKIVGHVPIPLGTAEHMPYIAKIPKETEALYPVLFGPPTITFLKQLHEAAFWGEIGMVICTIDAIASEPLKDILEGVWVLEYWPRLLQYDDTPYNREFRERCGLNELGLDIKKPEMAGLFSHMWPPWCHSLGMLKWAIEETGWKDKKDNAKIVKALEGATFKQSYGYVQRDGFFRAEDHQGFHPHYLSRIENGRLHVKEYLDIEDIWFEPEPPTDFTKEPLD